MRNDARIWQWTDTQRSTLTRLWNEDATLHDIAEAIGCSWRQASDERARLGLPMRPKGWRPASAQQQWADHPEKPQCADPEAAFAHAMKGRAFGSLRVSPDPRRMRSVSRDAGRWASSVTL